MANKTNYLVYVSGVRAEETTGVIIASIIAAVLLISLVMGVALFCYFRLAI